MGRSKVLATEEKTVKVITTASSYKIVIPTSLGVDIGEYIKLDKRDNEVVLHFTKRIDKSAEIKEGNVIVRFD
jgi:uncharacterized membrane protein YqgA involved in biofilm formation